MEFFRREYWSGLHSPGDLPNSGIEPRSHALQADSLLSEPLGKPKFLLHFIIKKKKSQKSVYFLLHIESHDYFCLAISQLFSKGLSKKDNERACTKVLFYNSVIFFVIIERLNTISGPIPKHN